MAPRAVYLIPSMPAVESPNVIIFYQNRCLFLTPKFDTDPPGVHPSYLSTYTSPWELKRPLILGPNCAFWDLGRGRLGTRKLPAPLRPAFCEMEGGSWDLTGKNVPEGDLADDVRSVLLTNGYLGRLKRAAWDEESGRLAVLPDKDRDWAGDDKMHLFIIDVIN
ncbi:hypothetical protein HYDPIDRAFT_115918 [Hydnomerulius pinastri MD-312]|uniref:Unplaced genomic scaffold scaffold_28, whole genome shotgun sequence n=1 Tax=Hydnomerulius pinastri MD-312 TaxID=994086 RepID=A0A0C9WC83_9AGAM|nr:hypothetical protein HYDPIDRAFT_115918 [Hydnomerulius pinastri MD-312]